MSTLSIPPNTFSAPPNTITLHSANKEVLRITHDGRLVIGEGLSVDEATREAAKLLIASFEREIQKMVETRIAAACEVEHALRAELAEAKVERETVAEASLRSLEAYIDKLKQFAERAEKAEAALAEWSVLHLWGGTPEIIHEFIKGQQNRIHHCQDLEAECLEQARLLGMSGEREADLLGKLERLHSINENILVFAFRYALGRRSTAPGIVADVLINRWNELKPHTQIQVQREIGSAMAMGEAGGSIDLDTWQRVLALPVKP